MTSPISPFLRYSLKYNLHTNPAIPKADKLFSLFGLLCLTPLSTIFHYIVAISFINGGNRSTRIKPPTCGKSLINFITMLYRVHLAWVKLKPTTLVAICSNCIGSYKSNYHTVTTAPSFSWKTPTKYIQYNYSYN